jgi:hypothetical protein
MSSQRYERVRTAQPSLATQSSQAGWARSKTTIMLTNGLQVSANDEETPDSPLVPNSPPPSFRSRASSPTSRHLASDSHTAPVDQNLADTFDADGSDSDEENDGDDRQRLMRGQPTAPAAEQTMIESTSTAETRPPTIERRATILPVFAPTRTTGRVYGGGSGSDGVFANLSAKPETGGEKEEHPPVS